jgi:hypothetical protein
VFDPQGSLFFGSKHIIPFDLTDADIYVDVIVLCPLPQILEFALETPSGTIIDQSLVGQNVEFTSGARVAFFRITLPALGGDPAGSHAGQWKAILSLKDRAGIDKMLKDRKFAATFQTSEVGGALPYSLIAHAYSNLQFEVRLRQESLKPGAGVMLNASLKQYDVPFAGNATVWAEITLPDSSTTILKLQQIGVGVYRAEFITSLSGVYFCRVRAEGYANGKDKFTREKTLTAAVYRGDRGGRPGKDEPFAASLRRILSGNFISGRATEMMRELGIDLTAIGERLEEEDKPVAEREPVKRREPKRGGAPRLTIRAEAPARQLERPPVAPMKLPVAERPPAFPRIVRMFSHPEEAAAESTERTQMDADEKLATAFPRIVRMFSPPGDEPKKAPEKKGRRGPSKKAPKGSKPRR